MNEITSDQSPVAPNDIEDNADTAVAVQDNAQQTSLPLAPAAHGTGTLEVDGADEDIASGLDPVPAEVEPTAEFPAESYPVPQAAEPPPTWEAAVVEPEEAPARYFGPVGKRRSPLAVLVLCVVTLGLYGLIWHARTNRELSDFDPQMHVRSGRSTWAVTIPWLIGLIVTAVGAARVILDAAGIAPPFDPGFSVSVGYILLAGLLVVPYLTLLVPFAMVAVVMTAERIRVVEERAGLTTDVQIKPASMPAWLVVPLVGPLMLIGREQSRLNAVWDLISPPVGRRRTR